MTPPSPNMPGRTWRNTSCPWRSRSATSCPRIRSERSTSPRCVNRWQPPPPHRLSVGACRRNTWKVKEHPTMGFTKPYLPDVDPEELLRRPLLERLRFFTTDWAENGFGSPKMVPLIYLMKTTFFTIAGAIIATATSPGVAPFWRVSEWWNQPIVYQKLVLWIMLCEMLGVAGAWGPLMGRIKPMTGGWRFWLKPDTIRDPPWPWIPGTSGDRRTRLDIGLYAGVLVSLAVGLALPGVPSESLSERLPENTSGLVAPALIAVIIGLLLLLGLRDKVSFLSSRIFNSRIRRSKQRRPLKRKTTKSPNRTRLRSRRARRLLKWLRSKSQNKR